MIDIKVGDWITGKYYPDSIEKVVRVFDGKAETRASIHDFESITEVRSAPRDYKAEALEFIKKGSKFDACDLSEELGISRRSAYDIIIDLRKEHSEIQLADEYTADEYRFAPKKTLEERILKVLKDHNTISLYGISLLGDFHEVDRKDIRVAVDSMVYDEKIFLLVDSKDGSPFLRIKEPKGEDHD